MKNEKGNRPHISNRERIMQEIAGMSDKALSDLLLENMEVAGRLCSDCLTRHGDECPVGMNDCLLWDGSWLRKEWDGVSLLEVEA